MSGPESEGLPLIFDSARRAFQIGPSGKSIVGYTIRTPEIWITRFCNRLVHLALKSGSHKSTIVSQISGVLIVYPTLEHGTSILCT